MRENFSDITLMAYADGELDADARRRIERALTHDSALATRIEMFRTTRRAASDAFKAHLDAPVPDALVDRLSEMVERHERSTIDMTDNVVALRRKPRGSIFRLDLAIAASVALVVGGAIGYLGSGFGGVASTGGMVTADLTDPSLAAALRAVPSGDAVDLERGGRFRAIASFRDEADNICREFEIDSADPSKVVSVACAVEDQWRVQFTVLAANDEGSYAPASSLEALDAYMMAIGAGPPLSDDDERAVLDDLR